MHVMCVPQAIGGCLRVTVFVQLGSHTNKLKVATRPSMYHISTCTVCVEIHIYIYMYMCIYVRIYIYVQMCILIYI